MNKKGRYIIFSLVIFSVAVTLIDAIVHPDYFVKIPLKILFFLALPMLFFALCREDLKKIKSLFAFKKKGLLKSVLLGGGIYAVIVGGYFATRGIIDYSSVTVSLSEGMGITKDNFIYVSMYIAFMNSFLEEFFFRGFGFITLKKYTGRKFAYIFSSGIFAIYHVGMLVDMFDFPVLMLLLAGLIVGGCIFNYLNEADENIYASWFTHMFANFAINTVGLILFGIL